MVRELSLASTAGELIRIALRIGDGHQLTPKDPEPIGKKLGELHAAQGRDLVVRHRKQGVGIDGRDRTRVEVDSRPKLAFGEYLQKTAGPEAQFAEVHVEVV